MDKAVQVKWSEGAKMNGLSLFFDALASLSFFITRSEDGLL